MSERFWCVVSILPLIAFSFVMFAGFSMAHRDNVKAVKHAKIRVARDHIDEPRY